MSERDKLQECFERIHGIYERLVEAEIEFNPCLASKDWELVAGAAKKLLAVERRIEKRIEELNKQ